MYSGYITSIRPSTESRIIIPFIEINDVELTCLIEREYMPGWESAVWFTDKTHVEELINNLRV